MVSFELTDKQKAVQKQARDFAQREIKPIALDIDRAPENSRWDMVKKVAKKLAQEDLFYLQIPEKYGGNEFDALTTAIVTEEIAVGDAALGFMILGWHPAMYGSEEQQKQFLPGWCDKNNPKFPSDCITEPNASSDPAGMSTTVRMEGNDYIINGTKCFISWGGMASIFETYATLDKKLGYKGIRRFLVPSDLPGVSVGKIEDKMGFRASQTAEVIFQNVRVPKENLIGNPDESAFKSLMLQMNKNRVISGSTVALGVARAAYETALNFFRQAPDRAKSAIDQEAISFALSDMSALIEASRLIIWESCWLIDNNLPATRESSISKYFCSDAAVKVTQQAAQLLGLNGYTKDYPMEKYVRDSKIIQIYAGTNQIARSVVSRQIMLE